MAPSSGVGSESLICWTFNIYVCFYLDLLSLVTVVRLMYCKNHQKFLEMNNYRGEV